MSTPDQVPLLPTMADDPDADRSLREALAVLRDQATDVSLRHRIDDVLAGRASLRELARSDDFSAMVTPLAERGYAAYDALPDYQKAPPEERPDAGLIG